MDIISVALGDRILNFICASKHGDGSLERFVLREEGNPKYFELKCTVVTGCPDGFTGTSNILDLMRSEGFNQYQC